MHLTQMIEDVKSYAAAADLSSVPGWRSGAPYQIEPLAQGEYNLNYLLRQGSCVWVLRVNIGTQIGRTDQIAYEYRALQSLAGSGVTPKPYYVDATRGIPGPDGRPLGLLVMEYLPGEPLDYGRDLIAAARLFARLHSHHTPKAQGHLIREERPLSMTYEECTKLLGVYLASDLADADTRAYLADVLAWADEARHAETYFVSDPWPCIINTEVNSGNFIANRERNTLHLVDWEKPLWGDPSQDLSHFAVPTTTLWKTDCRLREDEKRAFLDAYRDAVDDAHLADTIVERVRLRDPFNCLRGISWSAMAWVTYQTGEHAVRNADTFRKVSSYLQMDFLRSLFADDVL